MKSPRAKEHVSGGENGLLGHCPSAEENSVRRGLCRENSAPKRCAEAASFLIVRSKVQRREGPGDCEDCSEGAAHSDCECERVECCLHCGAQWLTVTMRFARSCDATHPRRARCRRTAPLAIFCAQLRRREETPKTVRCRKILLRATLASTDLSRAGYYLRVRWLLQLSLLL